LLLSLLLCIALRLGMLSVPLVMLRGIQTVEGQLAVGSYHIDKQYLR